MDQRRAGVSGDAPAPRTGEADQGVGSTTAHWRNSRLCEGVEKGFCVLQIGRGEPFGEPAVDRLEGRQGIGGPALVAQQPGEARGRAHVGFFRAIYPEWKDLDGSGKI